MNMPEHRRLSGPYLVGAIIILAAAFAARVIDLDAQSLWYDEGNSVQMIFRSGGEIIDAAAGDIHPPFYYLLLAGWGRLAGTTEFAIRFLSLLFGLVTIAIVIRFSSDMFSLEVALLSGLFAALHPMQVYYSQEVRMYALLVLLSIGSAWLFLRWLEVVNAFFKRKVSRQKVIGWGLAYCLITAAGLYTHYSFPLVMIAEAIVFLVTFAVSENRLRFLVASLVLVAGVIVLIAPQVPTAIQQVTQWPRDVLPPLPPEQIISTLIYGTTYSSGGQWGWFVPPVLLAIMGFFPSPDGGNKSPRLHLSLPVVLLACMALLIPVGLVAARAMTEANLKFLLVPGLAFWILVARGALLGIEITDPAYQPEGERPATVFFMVIVLLTLTFIPLYQGFSSMRTDPAYARDDYRGLIERIVTESGKDAAIVLSAPNQIEVFSYYLPDGEGVLPLRRMSDQGAEESLDGLAAASERIYGVFWGELQHDPERTVERALEERAFPLSTEWFGSLRLVTYIRPAPPADAISVRSGALFGGIIELEGFTLSAEHLSGGEALGVTLFWRAYQPIEEHYRVFVHVYNPDGTILCQHDGEPASGLAPFPSWEVTQQVIDAHGMVIPPDTPPGEYPVVVGLYNPASGGDRLMVTEPGGEESDAILIATLTISD